VLFAFSGATPENQLMLMLTAIAPSITPQEAVAITGNEQAPRLLEYLCRRHLFTDRRLGEETSYHYHALFREFLLAQFRKRFTVEERRAASVRAAELLAKRGQVREALALFRDAGEWDAMNALIHANALDWARTTLSDDQKRFLAALPLTVERAPAMFVHASADRPSRWDYVDSATAALRCVQASGTTYTFCGHVHDQQLYFATQRGRMSLFEPVPGTPVPVRGPRQWLAIVGSVGQPRDRNPAAAYAIFDDAKHEVTFFRVPYDHRTAAAKIRAAGLPGSLAYRVEAGI